MTPNRCRRLFNLKCLQLNFVLTMLVVFSASTPSHALLFGQLKVIDRPQFTVFEINGDIDQLLIENVDAAFNETPQDKRVIFSFDSRGGYNKAAYQIIEKINNEKQAGRQVDTYVRPGRTCGSICVLLFMAGEKRMASPASAFYFHGTSTLASNIPDQEKTQEVLTRFVQAGVSEVWLNELKDKGVFTTPGKYWISSEALYEEGSNIVTHLRDRHQVEEPVSLPFDPQIRPR